MRKNSTIMPCKMFIALLLVGATHIAMGSFTGSSEGKSKNQFTLKEFNKTLNKTAAPFSLRSGFQYKGSQVISQKAGTNGVKTLTSIMRFEKGNTTYIYPYKHKVVVPKFATPTPPIVR